MIKNGGRIQFIVSPLLSQEDIDAINKGYEKKKIIGEALMREFREPENYFQEERLKDYFGEKCIEYDLNRAIKEKKLTPYYYYPIVVYLDDEEMEKYKEISYLASKECHKDKRGKLNITEKGKRLLLQRARIVAGAKAKLDVLRELMEKYKDDTHMLVYCGATRVQTFDADTSEADEEGERQIVAVSKILGNEFGMKVTHFTANESAEEREVIKRRFSTAEPYQAIVAIKCLDEGVNIPSIKTAFILASTTNPKEYIQRRAHAAERGYGAKWQRERRKFLESNPFCVKCYEEGHITMATVVDHIVPHRGDQKLFWDRGNWQPLCEHHHNVKTMTEDRYVEYKF